MFPEPTELLLIGCLIESIWTPRSRTKVEVSEGQIFTHTLPTRWEEEIAEGCVEIASAVCLPTERPGLPAPRPRFFDLFGRERLLHTSSSEVWVFRCALREEQVLPAHSSGFDWAVRGHLPHSMGGTAALPLSIFAWRRPTSRAANWRALLGVATRFVEGRCTLDGTLVV